MEFITILGFIGRILLGAYFVIAGSAHFRHQKMMVGYAASRKVPYPNLAVAVTGLLLMAGGLGIFLGHIAGGYTWGPIALIIFFLGVTPKMHDFWNVKDPAERQAQKSNFLRNMAFLGIALILLSL